MFVSISKKIKQWKKQGNCFKCSFSTSNGLGKNDLNYVIRKIWCMNKLWTNLMFENKIFG